MLTRILNIALRKSRLDRKSTWSEGASTYLENLKKEIGETEEELEKGDDSALEEELGDVLWDYLNLIQCLEKERNISLDGILRRCEQKFEERISALEQGMSWKEIKELQNRRKQVSGKDDTPSSF